MEIYSVAYFDHITLFELNLASFPGYSVWEREPGNKTKINLTGLIALTCTLYVSKFGNMALRTWWCN